MLSSRSPPGPSLPHRDAAQQRQHQQQEREQREQRVVRDRRGERQIVAVDRTRRRRGLRRAGPGRSPATRAVAAPAVSAATGTSCATWSVTGIESLRAAGTCRHCIEARSYNWRVEKSDRTRQARASRVGARGGSAWPPHALAVCGAQPLPHRDSHARKPGDERVLCDRCRAEMFRMHAVWRCPACGYKTDCCGW